MARTTQARKHEDEAQENAGHGTGDILGNDTSRNESSSGTNHVSVGEVESQQDGGVSAEAKTPKKTIEEKRSDFNRLMSGRMSRIMDAMTQLTRLSNTAGYEWEEAQIERAMRTIREKLNAVEASFVAAKMPKEPGKRVAKNLSYIA
jgi:hypothetical protein